MATTTRFECNPLDDPAFAKVYMTWINSTNQYDTMLQGTQEFIELEFGKNKKEQGLKILSVGAGDGKFDATVLAGCKDLKVNKISFFEPNADFQKVLKERFEGMDIPCVIFPQDFEPTSKPDDEYDFVLFAHSLYGVKPNSETVFSSAKQWLKPGGKALAILQAECPFPRICRAAREHDLTFMGETPLDHGLTIQMLEPAMQGIGIGTVSRIIEATVDVDCLLNDEKQDDDANKERGLNLLSFVLGADISSAPEELIQKWKGLVRKESRQGDDGKWTMPTLDGFISFSKEMNHA